MGTDFTGHITGFNDGEMGKVEDYSEVSILSNRESDISAMQIGSLRGKIYLENNTELCMEEASFQVPVRYEMETSLDIRSDVSEKVWRQRLRFRVIYITMLKMFK